MVRLFVVVARPPGVGVGVDGGAELGAGEEVEAADGAAVGACIGTYFGEIGCIALESPRAGVQVRGSVGGGSAGAGSGVRGDVETSPSLGDQEFQISSMRRERRYTISTLFVSVIWMAKSKSNCQIKNCSDWPTKRQIKS